MAKTLTQLINDKDMSTEDKLTKILSKVNTARKAYGNENSEIAVPEVNTCEGMVELTYLSNDDKVELAASEINSIRTTAIETTKYTEGSVLDREIERLLSVNPILVNLASESDSEYI